MPALYIMIPAALLIVAIAIYIFFWAVDSGQYDDLDSPAHSILFDDQDPQHTAAVEEAKGITVLKPSTLPRLHAWAKNLDELPVVKENIPASDKMLA